MNWNWIQFDWMRVKEKVRDIRDNWCKLTEEDHTGIGGFRTELSRLQARYGCAKAEAEREVETWRRAQAAQGRGGPAAWRGGYRFRSTYGK